jgi:hypothetical protein
VSTIRITVDGETREVDQKDFAEFVEKKTKVATPLPSDVIKKALEPCTRDEYVGLLGDNPYKDIYLPEINRFLFARLELRTKPASAPSAALVSK